MEPQSPQRDGEHLQSLHLLDWILSGGSHLQSVFGRRLCALDLASRRVVFGMCLVCYTHRARPELFGHAAGRISSSGSLRRVARFANRETCDRLGWSLASGQETEQTGS